MLEDLNNVILIVKNLDLLIMMIKLVYINVIKQYYIINNKIQYVKILMIMIVNIFTNKQDKKYVQKHVEMFQDILKQILINVQINVILIDIMKMEQIYIVKNINCVKIILKTNIQKIYKALDVFLIVKISITIILMIMYV